jgi:cytochrome P450
VVTEVIDALARLVAAAAPTIAAVALLVREAKRRRRDNRASTGMRAHTDRFCLPPYQLDSARDIVGFGNEPAPPGGSVMPTSAVGDRYDPFGEHARNPYELYAEARRDEPVFYSKRLNAWVVTRYDDIMACERRPDLFSSANALRPVVELLPSTLEELGKAMPVHETVVNSDGKAHQRYRAPLVRALAPERVRALEPFIRERANALVDAFTDGRAEFMHQYAYPLPVQVISHLVGLDGDDAKAMERWSYEQSKIISWGVPEEEQAAGARSWVALQHKLADYIRARRAGPRQDLISEVLAALAPGEGPLSDEQMSELVWHLGGVFIAGHTTASSLLGTGLWHLLRQRDQWELLCDKPDLIPRAAEEIARYDAAVQGFFRVTTQAVTLGGVELPAGAELLLLYGSGNRDEVLVDEPEKFDITRQSTKHLAFGWGHHLCVGANLARSEIAISLATLTHRLPNLRLIDDQEVEIIPALLHRAPEELHVCW